MDTFSGPLSPSNGYLSSLLCKSSWFFLQYHHNLEKLETKNGIKIQTSCHWRTDNNQIPKNSLDQQDYHLTSSCFGWVDFFCRCHLLFSQMFSQWLEHCHKVKSNGLIFHLEILFGSTFSVWMKHFVMSFKRFNFFFWNPTKLSRTKFAVVISLNMFEFFCDFFHLEIHCVYKSNLKPIIIRTTAIFVLCIFIKIHTWSLIVCTCNFMTISFPK